MIDAHGRNIEYLRLSLTQSCNLRCIYCSPQHTQAENLLTAQQIEQLVRIMADLGISKVRLTGGEPLMRNDIEDIANRICAVPGIKDIPITTNGIELASRLPALQAAGITRLNISLDSLSREKFRRITGYDGLNQVRNAVMMALEMKMSVKINTVLIRGVNDDEVADFVALARENTLETRFIELMPMGKFGEDNPDKAVKSQEVLAKFPELSYFDKGASGVAELYTAPGFKGYVGFISPISHQFCDSCNRIRLTSDGKLRPCLGNNNEVDLRPLLGDADALREAITSAIYNKPQGHYFDKGFSSQRYMQHIGG